MALESRHGDLIPGPHTELKSPGGGTNNLGIFIAAVGGLCFVGAVVWALLGTATTGISLGIGALVCIGIGMFFVIRAQRESKAWEDFEFHFPEWSMSLGSVHDITVVRRSKTSIADQPHVTLPASIRCQELVRYQVGTDTKTERHNVVDAQLEVLGSIQENTFTGILTLPIPADRGAPTLDLEHNKIDWLLNVDPANLSSLGYAMTIEIPVRSELHKRKRQIVDGPPPPSTPTSDA